MRMGILPRHSGCECCELSRERALVAAAHEILTLIGELP
jgi:hypothetical protein